MIFVDTNYFLRFLLKDVDTQHQAAKELFVKGALGEKYLFTSAIVIFEIYWVLFSFYRKRKRDIAKILKDILKMRFIAIDERGILEEAVDIFTNSNLDLEDSFNLICAKKMGCSEFKTFDSKLEKKFTKIAGQQLR